MELCVTNRNDDLQRPRDLSFSATFALMAMAMACAIFLCAVPRPVPFELPVLTMDERAVREQIEADRRLAGPPQSELARALYQTLRDAGRSELDADETRAYKLEQRIRALKKRVETELSAEGLRAVRAYATERFMLALSAELDDENEERELIGAQRSMFAAYGYITPEGHLLAPELTLRAMFKVRWNMIFHAPPTASLSAIEAYAYEGFRALEATNLPPELRFAALYEWIRAGGGLRAERALAILQAASGKAGPLVARVQGSENEAAQLRLRNMALTALPRPDAP